MGQGGEGWDFKKTRDAVQDYPRNIQKKRREVNETDKCQGEKCLTMPGWAPSAAQALLQLQWVTVQRATLGGSAAPAAPLPMALGSPNLPRLGSALGSSSRAAANAWGPSSAGHLPCHLNIMWMCPWCP